MTLPLYRNICLWLTGLCGLLSIAVHLWGTEAGTGFARFPGLFGMLLALLGIFCLGFLWFSRGVASSVLPIGQDVGTGDKLEKEGESGVQKGYGLSSAARGLSLLCAAGTVGMVVMGVYDNLSIGGTDHTLINGRITAVSSGPSWFGLLFFGLMPLCATVFFLLLGLSKQPKPKVALWLSFPTMLWLAALLMKQYISYTAVRYVLSQTLSLCTLCGALLFVMALGRLVGELPPRERGEALVRRYGACYGLVGFSACIGLTAAMLSNIGSRGFGPWDVCFFLPLSMLALCLVIEV